MEQNSSPFAQSSSEKAHKTLDLLRDDLVPASIYPQSSMESQSEPDLTADHSIGINEDLNDNETDDAKTKYESRNAIVIAGPATIKRSKNENKKVLMIYPFPCKILQTFSDSQLGVQLAWPYNDVFKKFPSSLIERNMNDVSNEEQKYMKQVDCNDLGYPSIKQIQMFV